MLSITVYDEAQALSLARRVLWRQYMNAAPGPIKESARVAYSALGAHEFATSGDSELTEPTHVRIAQEHSVNVVIELKLA